MIAIEQRIGEEGWTQAEAAARLHVTQPRVSDLLNGKIGKFSLDALVNMLAPVGLTFDIQTDQMPTGAGGSQEDQGRSTRITRKRSALSTH